MSVFSSSEGRGPASRTLIGGVTSYFIATGQRGPFVASLANGKWAPATAIAGIPALAKNAQIQFTAMSCASPGNCSAGGYYATLNSAGVTFVISDVNGTWRPATGIPGTSAAEPPGDVVFSTRPLQCCRKLRGWRSSKHLRDELNKALGAGCPTRALLSSTDLARGRNSRQRRTGCGAGTGSRAPSLGRS